MRIVQAGFFAAALGLGALPCAAQTSAPAAAPAGPSSLLRPALDNVLGTLNAVRLDKWKRGTVRDEAGQDIGSVVSDIQVNLPPLLRDSDTAPALVSRQVPLARNVDALYDVLLRVVDAARIAGPGEQADALQQALNTLSKARLAFYDQVQQLAAAQEKQVVDLRATVEKQASVQCPAPPPPAPCPPAPKKKKRAAKPSAAKPQNQAAPAAGTTPKTGS